MMLFRPIAALLFCVSLSRSQPQSDIEDDFDKLSQDHGVDIMDLKHKVVKAMEDIYRELNVSNLALKDVTSERNELRQEQLRLENEGHSLADDLSDTMDALRDSEARLADAEAALSKLRTETDEEIENIRRSGDRKIEELQRTLIEFETRYKTDISSMKKKYKTHFRDLEGDLENANKANAEYLQQIRALQQRIKEIEVLFEDECQVPSGSSRDSP